VPARGGTAPGIALALWFGSKYGVKENAFSSSSIIAYSTSPIGCGRLRFIVDVGL
jgi:hypothetical protein